MNEDEIESFIDQTIDDFKDEIRSRFVYNFDYNETNDLATCYRNLKPPLITFHIGTIKKASDCCKELIQELINHEVIHTFSGYEERGALSNQLIRNFHKNKEKQLDLLKWRLSKNE